MAALHDAVRSAAHCTPATRKERLQFISEVVNTQLWSTEEAPFTRGVREYFGLVAMACRALCAHGHVVEAAALLHAYASGDAVELVGVAATVNDDVVRGMLRWPFHALLSAYALRNADMLHALRLYEAFKAQRVQPTRNTLHLLLRGLANVPEEDLRATASVLTQGKPLIARQLIREMSADFGVTPTVTTYNLHLQVLNRFKQHTAVRHLVIQMWSDCSRGSGKAMLARPNGETFRLHLSACESLAHLEEAVRLHMSPGDEASVNSAALCSLITGMT